MLCESIAIFDCPKRNCPTPSNDDCRGLAEEELEDIAGSGYEKAAFRRKSFHYFFFTPSTFLHYMCPVCRELSERVK